MLSWTLDLITAPLFGCTICLFLFGFKNQLWNGSLVIAPADYAKLIYHKLVSYGINFEKGNKSFPTA